MFVGMHAYTGIPPSRIWIDEKQEADANDGWARPKTISAEGTCLRIFIKEKGLVRGPWKGLASANQSLVTEGLGNEVETAVNTDLMGGSREVFAGAGAGADGMGFGVMGLMD